MKNEKPNAELAWKQLDDLIPAAAPVAHRSDGLCESPAAQPPGRKTPPAIFDSMAGAQYRAILGAGASCGAPTGGPRRSAPGPAEQDGARGGGAAARGDSPREAE